MRISLLILLLCCSVAAFAQDTPEMQEASQKSWQYHELRLRCTTPPFGLSKVKQLVSTIRGKDEEEIFAIDFKQWQALSFREKFTYCMIHPEIYSQNCDAFAIVDEEKKIFAQLPLGYREERISERQLNFLRDNKDSVILLITESINRTGYVGLNYKEVLAEVNAVGMIPKLIEVYNKTKKDGDILTLLNLLMKRNDYAPFMESTSYKKLYEGDTYNAFINYNEANEALIIKRATEFYQSINK